MTFGSKHLFPAKDIAQAVSAISQGHFLEKSEMTTYIEALKALSALTEFTTPEGFAHLKKLNEFLNEGQPGYEASKPPVKDVVINNMGSPFTVKAYVTPKTPAQPAPVNSESPVDIEGLFMTEDEALKAAYLAGFNASGEGYNAEYPFHSAHPEQDADWIKNRNNEITAIKQARSAPVHGPSLTDLSGAIEYADARWSGVDVPIEWARHFADAIGEPMTTPPAAPVQPVQEPTIAACIIGAEAAGKKIDGYEAAKVYAAMRKAMGTPPTAQQTNAQDVGLISEAQRLALIQYGDARESKDPARISQAYVNALYTTAKPWPKHKPGTHLHDIILDSVSRDLPFDQIFMETLEVANAKMVSFYREALNAMMERDQGSTVQTDQAPSLTDGEIIDLANKELPGWTRKDNDLAYIKVVRAALATAQAQQPVQD
jgi:hypothetical protein